MNFTSILVFASVLALSISTIMAIPTSHGCRKYCYAYGYGPGYGIGYPAYGQYYPQAYGYPWGGGYGGGYGGYLKKRDLSEQVQQYISKEGLPQEKNELDIGFGGQTTTNA